MLTSLVIKRVIAISFLSRTVLMIWTLPVNQDYSIAQSISDVASELFIKNKIQFDVIIYRQMNSDTTQLESVLNEFLSLFGTQNYPVESITELHESKDQEIYIGQAALILMKSFRDLRKFNAQVRLINRFPSKLRFIVYIEEYFMGDILGYIVLPMKLTPFKGHIVQYQYFLVRDNDHTINLITLEWFIDKTCNYPQGVLKDTFNLVTRTWKWNLRTNFEKFYNFYECEMTIGSDSRYYEYAYKDKFDSKIKGSLVSFFKILGEKGKFVPHHRLLPQQMNTSLHIQND